MMANYKEAKETFRVSYDDPMYKGLIKRADVQVLQPRTLTTNYEDSSALRVYLNAEDYDMGIFLDRLSRFKKNSPNQLYDSLGAFNLNAKTQIVMDKLNALSPLSEMVDYSTHEGLAKALRYFGSVNRANAGRRYEEFSIIKEPPRHIVESARVLIDRLFVFNGFWDSRTFSSFDTFLTFEGTALSYQAVPWLEVTCNDMALLRLSIANKNPNVMALKDLVVWNRLDPAVFTSSDVFNADTNYYIVNYNPTIDMVFIWRMVNNKNELPLL